jgi:glycosyltransferase involved in cell wall biosynthesis
MRIAVILATYQRPDGKTPEYLTRALDSIMAQTHQDFQIYVIGDNYTDKDELANIVRTYPVKWINLPTAVERDKYPHGDYRLYCAGGVNAGLVGVKLALKDGFEYCCHMDHDDWWDPEHLEQINKVIEDKNPVFVCTLSTCLKRVLPAYPKSNEVLEYYPEPCGMICSSACIKYSDTKIRARDCFDYGLAPYPADADLWARLAQEMRETGKKGYLITSLSCHHEEEGYSLKK